MGRNLFADRTELAAKVEEAPASHPLMPALKMGTDCLTALEQVTDYKATFIKRELVGRKTLDTRMELKLREKPFSVYLKFLQPHAGREAIFVQGENNNHLLVHDVGFASLAGTISLDPLGSYAMDENRHPVTSIGMTNMVTKLVETWLAEIGLEGATVNYYPNAHIGQLPCKAIETSYSRKQTAARFQTTRLYVDKEHGWPVRLQAYDFPGRRDTEAPLVEDYLYTDLAVNVGLSDIDFSTKNPKYGF